MMRRAIAILVLLAAAASYAAAEVYLWPLHGERRLSSSFGEFREGHYHAGIDLRTFGRTGLPTIAIAEGSIVRVKIAPSGYGKAVYLMLEDGVTAVYAHLGGFDGRIDSLAYHRRLDTGSSWCDLHLPAGRYRYGVGDTLAFTGISGTSAPHLHFELRDDRERPFNPLESLYSLPDDVPPVISGLEVVPLRIGSTAGGSPVSVTALFRASGRQGYVLEDTLRLDGRFGFGVSVWDEQGFGLYRMAPMSVEIFIDGLSLYRSVNTSFSYSQTNEIRLEYDILGSAFTDRFLLLFRKAGCSRSDRGGHGVVHCEPDLPEGMYLERGIHRGEIVARDASGNESRAFFTFVMNRSPVIRIAKRLAAAAEAVVAAEDPEGGIVVHELYESLDGGSSWSRIDLAPFGSHFRGAVSDKRDAVYRYVARDSLGGESASCFAAPVPLQREGRVFAETVPEVLPDGLLITVRTDRALAALPDIRLAGGTHAVPEVLAMTGPGRFTAIFTPSQLGDGVNLVQISGMDHRGYPLRSVSAFRIVMLEGGKVAEIELPGGIRARLRLRTHAGPAVCLVREVALQEPPPRGLRAVSRPFRIDYGWQHASGPLRLECDREEKVGLFQWRKGKGWKCLGVPAMEGGRVKIDRCGIYAFFMDGLPPDIKYLAVEERMGGSGFFKPYRLYVPVEERGSGVDPYSATATINGRRVVCEWDEFRGRLYIPVTASEPAGTVSVTVELGDRAGNRSVGEFGIMIE